MIINKTESSFPTPTQERWEALVAKGLRDKPMSSLLRETEDGIIRGPLNTKSERPEHIVPLPRMRPPLLDGRAWHINAPVRDPELKFSNAQLLDDLKGGASGARIELGWETLKVSKTSHIERLLDQVFTDLIPITLAPSSDNVTATNLLMNMKQLKNAVVNLGLDPIEDKSKLSDIIKACPKSWRAMTINGANVHDNGGTAVQEVAFIAASTAEVMRNLGTETAHAHLNIELAVDQDAHAGIAKIRATRRIYARIAESFGLKTTQIPIHAISSKRMLQGTDPWTNLLRVMSANFGAIIGGADYITARPFTDAIGHATPFGYRIARNMQLMMMEESQLGQVQDAAYGSYFHESLTNALAQKAWEGFQRIESLGGIQAYKTSKDYQADLDTSIAKRDALAEPVLGVTLHPAPDLRKAKTRHTA